jgi:DNA-binding response OmpR family regulator
MNGMTQAEMKTLIVEDDRKLGLFLKKGFEEQSYRAVLATDLESAREAFYGEKFDVIVLDIGLPDGNGLGFLKELRENGDETLVIVLSARGQMEDRVNGLNLGADDYLAKPFGFAELLARVRSLTRRRQKQLRTVLEHEGIRMDLLRREVVNDGEKVELTAREYALLELFLQNPGRVLTRTQIAEEIWDCHFDRETNLIDVYVRKLRTKLGGDSGNPIGTVRGVGYCLK